jgi:hypothetical protein
MIVGEGEEKMKDVWVGLLCGGMGLNCTFIFDCVEVMM